MGSFMPTGVAESSGESSVANPVRTAPPASTDALWSAKVGSSVRPKRSESSSTAASLAASSSTDMGASVPPSSISCLRRRASSSLSPCDSAPPSRDVLMEPKAAPPPWPPIISPVTGAFCTPPSQDICRPLPPSLIISAGGAPPCAAAAPPESLVGAMSPPRVSCCIPNATSVPPAARAACCSAAGCVGTVAPGVLRLAAACVLPTTLCSIPDISSPEKKPSCEWRLGSLGRGGGSAPGKEAVRWSLS
eukprot:scaffold12036_cov61-Phaeocystis_antarctica.AAC.9